MKELVKIVALKDLSDLAAYRVLPGLKACVHNEYIWLRGMFTTAKENTDTQKIPAINTYLLGEDNLLFPLKGITPVQKLPELNWQPLKELIPISFPTAAMSGQVGEKLKITLSKTEQQQAIYAVELELHDWLHYTANISNLRLKQIKFAINATKKVLVLNASFISLPGKLYWQQQHNLLPLGYNFNPPLLGELIQKTLNPQQQNILVFETNGTYTSIALEHFMDARRDLLNVLKAGNYNAST